MLAVFSACFIAPLAMPFDLNTTMSRAIITYLNYPKPSRIFFSVRRHYFQAENSPRQLSQLGDPAMPTGRLKFQLKSSENHN